MGLEGQESTQLGLWSVMTGNEPQEELGGQRMGVWSQLWPDRHGDEPSFCLGDGFGWWEASSLVVAALGDGGRSA